MSCYYTSHYPDHAHMYADLNSDVLLETPTVYKLDTALIYVILHECGDASPNPKVICDLKVANVVSLLVLYGVFKVSVPVILVSYM